MPLLADEERAELEGIGHTIHRSAGDPFFLEGELGDFALLIKKGHVKAVRGRPPRIIDVRGPGAIVGEMGVIRRRPRMASIIAFDDVEALYLPGARWLRFLYEHPRAMHALLVMTDDIYEHIRFDGRQTLHLLAVAPDLRDRTLAINGVSKTYAMTGWRIGWAAGPRDLIQALETLLSQSAGNCCAVSQAAAAAALNGDQGFVAECVAIYQERRDRTAQRINAIPGLSCAVPDGAFYLYVNCAGLIGKSARGGKRLATDGDVVMHLLESAGVAVVAGAAYGLSPYFRVSIATSIETLMEAWPAWHVSSRTWSERGHAWIAPASCWLLHSGRIFQRHQSLDLLSSARRCRWR